MHPQAQVRQPLQLAGLQGFLRLSESSGFDPGCPLLLALFQGASGCSVWCVRAAGGLVSAHRLTAERLSSLCGWRPPSSAPRDPPGGAAEPWEGLRPQGLGAAWRWCRGPHPQRAAPAAPAAPARAVRVRARSSIISCLQAAHWQCVASPHRESLCLRGPRTACCFASPLHHPRSAPTVFLSRF